MWVPISVEGLAALLTASIAQMEVHERLLWHLVRVPRTKWGLPPWGNPGGGFWVVGLIGQQVIWYNDIEGGFNVSRYGEAGAIADYWCNQDELHHVIWRLGEQIESNEFVGQFGPAA